MNPWPETPSSPWLWRALLAMVGLLMGLGLAEGLARVVGPPLPGFVLDATLTAYEPRLYMRHPTRISTVAPNVDVSMEAIEYSTRVRTDRLGLRGAPVPDGARRVAFIGDSFTLGVQVSEAQTFAERVAEQVSTVSGHRTVALNAGVDGYGVRQSIDRLEELLRSTRVTHAVLTVYLGNDLRDDARLDAKRAAMNQPPPPEQEAQLDPIPVMRQKSAWARVSRLYAWIQVVRAIQARTSDFRLQEYADELAIFVDPSALEDQLPGTSAGLRAFGVVCQHRRLRCAVALAPPAWAVHPERAPATFEAFGLNPDTASVESVRDAVAEAVPAGVQVIDLTPPLQAAGTARPLYHVFDPHWNPAGHAVVAEVLSGAMQW